MPDHFITDKQGRFKVTKAGTTDRFVTESQLPGLINAGFSKVAIGTAPQAPVAPPTDPLQRKAFDFAQKLPQPQIPIPPPLADITPESLKPADTTVLPPIVTEDTISDISGVVPAANKIKADIKARQDILKETRTAEQKQDIDLSSEIQKLLPQLGGKATFEAETRTKLEGDLDAQLTFVNNEIDALIAEKERFRIGAEGKPITLSSITGQIAQNNAKLNGEILTLTARANALMGNLALAERQVQAAVDARFKPIEEEIAIKRAQRAAISDIVSKDERTQLDALEAADKAKEKEIAEDKQKEKDIQNIMLDAINAGIKNKDTLDRISTSETLEEAAKIMANNLPEAEVGTQIISAGGRKLLVNKQTGETIKDLGSSTASGGGDEFPDLNLSEANLAKSRGNYFVANPEATEADFNALSNEEKFAWVQGGPEEEPTAIELVVNYRNQIVALQKSGLSAKEAIKLIKGEENDPLDEQELNIFKEVFEEEIKDEAPGAFFKLKKTEIENYLKEINK